MAALEELFAADVTSYSDGGGVVRASRIPVLGARRVAKYIRAFADRFWAGVGVRWASTNGQASALLTRDGAVFAVLAADAVAVCDGGAKVRAPVHPIHGAHEVALLVDALLTGRSDAVLTVEAVNGHAGLTLRRAGTAVAAVSVGVAGTEVTAVWIVLNPDKLRGWHRRWPTLRCSGSW